MKTSFDTNIKTVACNIRPKTVLNLNKKDIFNQSSKYAWNINKRDDLH